ncbi:MAG: nif-specific transcriptional activator NifA [Candidatus Omnitrophica bacterium]|nr:nif-specific transcriptional activator NifA [Candidatus Omnitrophota bacterium]
MNKSASTEKSKSHHSSGLERKVTELKTLYELASAISSSLDLEVVMNSILDVLHRDMGMERGTLTLLDSQNNELFIEVAHGLAKEEIDRGRYRIGEGITGKVVAAGEPIVVPNVGDEPLFLNRTGSRGDIKKNTISFICVPIKLDQKTIGALSVDRLFNEEISLDEDVRLLTVISSMITQAVRNHLKVKEQKDKLESENVRLKSQLRKKFHPENIIGESKRIADVLASVELISQTRATVLLRGESGTGKELIANAIHYNSDRLKGPFIKISCAALPENLLESELFGYEKGAFTGANANKLGRFELAHEGTLFLDEIGDIPPSTQVKLLRVLQEREFERLGGTKTIRVDIRLIAATNKDLEAEVKAGRFREDLYYRLNVVPIFLPALRERKEDLPGLANFFIEKSNRENNKKVKYISDAALEHLLQYPWPGNVRELENAFERAIILCRSDTLEPENFPITVIRHTADHAVSSGGGETTEAGSLTVAVENLEKKMIMEALERTDGNQRKAAKQLGITERILGYKIRTYGLKE